MSTQKFKFFALTVAVAGTAIVAGCAAPQYERTHNDISNKQTSNRLFQYDSMVCKESGSAYDRCMREHGWHLR